MLGDADRFVPLLVRLEVPCSASGLDEDTNVALVRFALTSDSDYWADLALNSVGEGIHAGQVADELRRLAESGGRRPQALRHKALRLLPKS